MTHRSPLGTIAVALAICGHVKTAPAQGRGAPPTNIYAATGKNALAPAVSRHTSIDTPAPFPPSGVYTCWM